MSQSNLKTEPSTDLKARSIPNPLTVADLSAKLKAKTEANRAEIEQIITASLQTLTASLQRSAKKELSTTRAVIKKQTEAIEQTLSQALEQIQVEAQELQKKRRLWPRLLLVLGIISSASLATVLLQTWLIDRDLAASQAAIRTMQETLAYSQTWGIQMSESSAGRFLILPRGQTLETGYTLKDGREAAKIKKQ